MSQSICMTLLAGTAVTFGAVAGASADQTARSNDELRAIVAEMMADAESRSSLLQSGGTAGHDGKFFLADPSGNFRLNVGGQIQFRYNMNFRDDSGNGEDEFESGFQTRRTKLRFDGNVFDPNLFYAVQGAFDYSDGGGFSLEDAYAGYRFDNGWTMRWGQFKLPFMREELVSSKYQLAADRSLVNEVFNQDWSQGVELSYEAEDWRFAAAFSDGIRTRNTDYTDVQALGIFGAAGNGGEADFGVTARAEFKLNGMWSQFKDFSSRPGSDYGMMLGVAAHYEYGDSTETAAGLGQYNYFSWTIDLSIEGDGWNLFAAGVGAHQKTNDAFSSDDFGIVLQGGIFIPDTDWELFARYDVLLPDDSEGVRVTDDPFNTITVGANYYMHGHAAKFTFDVQYFIDDLSSQALFAPGNTGIGYLGDDDTGEVNLRVQFQLLF